MPTPSLEEILLQRAMQRGDPNAVAADLMHNYTPKSAPNWQRHLAAIVYALNNGLSPSGALNDARVPKRTTDIDLPAEGKH